MPAVNSKMHIPLEDPEGSLQHVVDHLAAEHDLTFDPMPNGDLIYQVNGYVWELGVRNHGLSVRLEASDESAMLFLKENVVAHFEGLDAAAAAKIRWSGDDVRVGEAPTNFTLAQVVRSTEIFPGMQRVTLRCDGQCLFEGLGVHVRLLLPPPNGRPPVWPVLYATGVPKWAHGDDALHDRWMTIRHARPDCGEVDIDIVRHAGGPVSDWAESAMPGHTVGLMGPAGLAELPAHQGLFLAVDGTGLPVLARYLESLENDAGGEVVAAFPSSADVEAYLGQTSLNIHTVDPANFAGAILDKAKDLTAPGKTLYAFFAGEFQNAQDLRGHFKKHLGLGKHEQLSTAFWRQE